MAATVENLSAPGGRATAGASRHCLQQSAHRRLAALDPFPGRPDPLEILFQDHLHGRMGQDQLAQVTLMGRAPVALAPVTITVAQEEPF